MGKVIANSSAYLRYLFLLLGFKFSLDKIVCAQVYRSILRCVSLMSLGGLPFPEGRAGSAKLGEEAEEHGAGENVKSQVRV